MKESDFQKWVTDVAQRFGWHVWHVPVPTRPIGGSKFVPDRRGRGLPDLIMLHDDPPRLIFAEVKGFDGVLSDSQREFLRMARSVADDIRELIRAVEAVLATGDRVFAVGEDTIPLPASGMPVGVYTWRPGGEHIIEEILRGRVMIA